MTSYVLDFAGLDHTMITSAGGKGANLGELTKVDGIVVPDGFCVTTNAYQLVTQDNATLRPLLAELSAMTTPDAAAIADVSARIRSAIEQSPVAGDLADEIASHYARLGDNVACAVRSSATAEDLPTASFAGQQDTYLNAIGIEAITDAIARCWASLFTDRAVAYRIQNGFDHTAVSLAVVVQTMVFPDVSGIMFTADPITSNRKVVAIDAGFGLGEALVSGLVTADSYRVRDGAVAEKTVSTKKVEIVGSPDGGTHEVPVEAARQGAQALTDDQIVRLAQTGRTIEAHFGQPQDIEWGLVDGQFVILQARPITTLFPLPQITDDKLHVYTSFSHQQMMTDAMKPLGLSFMQAAESTLAAMGGRLYMELSHDLATPSGRAVAKPALKLMDPLVATAVDTLLARKDFVANLARGKKFLSMGSGYFSWALIVSTVRSLLHPDASVIPTLIAGFEASARDLDARLSALHGPELIDRIKVEYVEVGKAISSPASMATVWVGAMTASSLNKRIKRWLDEERVADALVQAVPHNNTSQMGLDLLDVADAVRDYPDVVDYLGHPSPETFFDDLEKLPGGDAVSAAIHGYLDKYGARCVGEIDITRPRWIEQPTALAPMILDNIRNFPAGASRTRHDEGLAAAMAKRDDILTRLAARPGGARKARAAAKKIDVLRDFAGYREYPKHAMMLSYWAIKRALLREAGDLVEAGVLDSAEDIFYLTLDELDAVVRTRTVDAALIEARKNDFVRFEKLTPPRVITSDGEIPVGTYGNQAAPAGALVGIAASSGIAEGRARVVTRLEDVAMEPGDILVTPYTDPSWTPVFVSIKGLVTEVGGVATHGSVIAREYGLPAVVGVENAATLIRDGQRIRVNGTDGWVDVL